MKTLKYVLVSIFSCVIVIGCGGKGEKKKEGFSYEKQTSEFQEDVVDDNYTNIVISANDMMKFDKTVLKAKAGKKVKLTLRHIGKLDVKIMGHNFVLLKKGTNLATFGNKAAVASATGYIPADSQDVIVHTKLIGGGETTSIEFDSPEPGEYEFLCSFPGHYSMMKGKFIVE